MKSNSAGLLMFNVIDGNLKLLLAHPGGPYFKNKDLGSWTIPKGLANENEDLQTCAKREFNEETGITPVAPFIDLGFVIQKGGKTVYAWAFESTTKLTEHTSNTFSMQWPPNSGKIQYFPEIDKIAFFSIEEAKTKMLEAQIPFITRLSGALNYAL